MVESGLVVDVVACRACCDIGPEARRRLALAARIAVSGLHNWAAARPSGKWILNSVVVVGAFVCAALTILLTMLFLFILVNLASLFIIFVFLAFFVVAIFSTIRRFLDFSILRVGFITGLIAVIQLFVKRYASVGGVTLTLNTVYSALLDHNARGKLIFRDYDMSADVHLLGGQVVDSIVSVLHF
jgi:hypothetical protein